MYLEIQDKGEKQIDLNGDGWILSRGADEYMQGSEDVGSVMNERVGGKYELVPSRLLSKDCDSFMLHSKKIVIVEGLGMNMKEIVQ